MNSDVISPERLAGMQAGWVQLMGRYGVEPQAGYPVFDRLVEAYSEPHRYYHNLEHLAEMFKVAGKLADVSGDFSVIQLAIWFHDAIYDPRAKDNEERSAALATELLRPLGIPDELLSHLSVMIMSTSHTTFQEVDRDTAVLLDADLAILAAEERRYARYAADVRREYAWVDESAYRAGRRGVLERFLSRARIYHTERMHNAAEEAARRNLMNEIALLASSA